LPSIVDRIMKTTMQRFTILATISLAFLLVSPALAHAESNQSVPKTLNLALAGTFLNINSQRLQQSGGFLVGLSIFGRTMDTSTAQLQYSMDASVQGTTVSGTVTFSITGTRDGHAYSVTGNSVLVGMNPAFGTPLTDPTNPLACLLSSCTSEVPAFLVGLTNIQVTGIEPHDSEEHQASNTCAPVSGVFDEHSTLPLTVSTPVTFESAYMNPFGGPTVIASGCRLHSLHGSDIHFCHQYMDGRPSRRISPRRHHRCTDRTIRPVTQSR
jgi:hypothetical protein